MQFIGIAATHPAVVVAVAVAVVVAAAVAAAVTTTVIIGLWVQVMIHLIHLIVQVGGGIIKQKYGGFCFFNFISKTSSID
jgi:uncharacterized Fe-S center protein